VEVVAEVVALIACADYDGDAGSGSLGLRLRRVNLRGVRFCFFPAEAVVELVTDTTLYTCQIAGVVVDIEENNGGKHTNHHPLPPGNMYEQISHSSNSKRVL
jgi:hypothetical protein